MDVMKAEKIVVETQTEEQHTAAYVQKQEEREQHNADRELRWKEQCATKQFLAEIMKLSNLIMSHSILWRVAPSLSSTLVFEVYAPVKVNHISPSVAGDISSINPRECRTAIAVSFDQLEILLIFISLFSLLTSCLLSHTRIQAWNVSRPTLCPPNWVHDSYWRPLLLTFEQDRVRHLIEFHYPNSTWY